MKKILYIIVLIMFALYIDKISAYTEYKVGDEVTYNGIDFYVIKNSDNNEDTVTMLKAEPLTVDEVNLYGGVGTNNNHVNMYLPSDNPYYQKARNNQGYGQMLYQNTKDCGYYDGVWQKGGCTSDYESSDIKYVIDAWSSDKIKSGLIKARLLNDTDLVDSLGYEYSGDDLWIQYDNKFRFIIDYDYWWIEHSKKDYFLDERFCFMYYGDISLASHYPHAGGASNDITGIFYGEIRPVVELYKCVLDDSCKSDNPDDNKEIPDNNKDNTNYSTDVKVDNTYMSKSLILITTGFIISSISILILYKLSNKKSR